MGQIATLVDLLVARLIKLRNRHFLALDVLALLVNKEPLPNRCSARDLRLSARRFPGGLPALSARDLLTHLLQDER